MAPAALLLASACGPALAAGPTDDEFTINAPAGACFTRFGGLHLHFPRWSLTDTRHALWQARVSRYHARSTREPD